MKNIIVFSLFLVLLMGCKKEYPKKINSADKDVINTETMAQIKDKSLFYQQENKDFSFIDSLKIFDLPIGNEILQSYVFPKQWDFGSPHNAKRKIKKDEIIINNILGFYDGYTPEEYKHQKTNSFDLNFFNPSKEDYRLRVLDKNKINYYGLSRLSDKNDSIKVITIWFAKENINPDKEFPWSVSYGDLLTISNNKIIDKLTIDRFEGSNSLGGNYRVSYINEEYDIHTSDFYYGENQGNKIRNERWRIKDNGKIVRYFKEKDTILSFGLIKNHLQDGTWQEINPDPNLTLKNNAFNIEQNLSYSEGAYSFGEKEGEWKYYEYNGVEKGKLVYIETYKNGELQKRTFMK